MLCKFSAGQVSANQYLIHDNTVSVVRRYMRSVWPGYTQHVWIRHNNPNPGQEWCGWHSSTNYPTLLQCWNVWHMIPVHPRVQGLEGEGVRRITIIPLVRQPAQQNTYCNINPNLTLTTSTNVLVTVINVTDYIIINKLCCVGCWTNGQSWSISSATHAHRC